MYRHHFFVHVCMYILIRMSAFEYVFCFLN